MNAYKIETERLILRCYEPFDAPSLKMALEESIEHIYPWLIWSKKETEPIEKHLEQIRIFRGKFDLNQDYVYGIFSKDNKTLIGSTGLHTRRGEHVFEIGYWIRTSECLKGYAQESTLALTKVGFEISKKQRIEIYCNPNNLKSVRIPQKIGFTHEATLKNRILDREGNYTDVMLWSLFRDDYEKSMAKNTSIQVFNALGERIYP